MNPPNKMRGLLDHGYTLIFIAKKATHPMQLIGILGQANRLQDVRWTKNGR